MEGDEDKEKNEKINEWSKTVKGGTRSGCVKHERKPSNVTSNNRHKLFEDNYDVDEDEDEDKSASDGTCEELKTNKNKNIRNIRRGKNENKTWDNFNDECKEETVLKEFELIQKMESAVSKCKY